MSEDNERRERKRKRQAAFLKKVEELPVESPRFRELVELLQEMEEKDQHIDVRLCPSCKSPRVRSTCSGLDPLGHMNILPRKYECPECGWRGRLELLATNRPRDYGALSGI